MEALSSCDFLLFEGFRWDHRGGVLFRFDETGAAEPVQLGSRSLALLGLLLERAGELLAKNTIMKTVWPGRVVEESNLNVQIAKLRHILDQGRGGRSCIQTIIGYGYRFVLPVMRLEPGAPAMIQTIVSGGTLQRPPRSIVVLPFVNLGGDREQQQFADEITEDLTTDLSRIENTFVISRTTAFTYRDRAVDIRQIGRELGIRYVLEGSVRRYGQQLRVNAQLIDAETDAHLWAERFEGDVVDPFALEDDITGRITAALDRQLGLAGAVQER